MTSADGKPPLSPCRSQQSLTSPRATRSVMARNRKVSDEQLQSVAATTAAVSQKFAETLVDGMFPFKVKDNESGRIFRLTSR